MKGNDAVMFSPEKIRQGKAKLAEQDLRKQQEKESKEQKKADRAANKLRMEEEKAEGKAERARLRMEA
jgi:hypothetical protein